MSDLDIAIKKWLLEASNDSDLFDWMDGERSVKEYLQDVLIEKIDNLFANHEVARSISELQQEHDEYLKEG